MTEYNRLMMKLLRAQFDRLATEDITTYSTQEEQFDAMFELIVDVTLAYVSRFNLAEER